MNQALTSRLYEYQYQFDAAGNRTQMKYFDGSTTASGVGERMSGGKIFLHDKEGKMLPSGRVGKWGYGWCLGRNGNGQFCIVRRTCCFTTYD